MTRAWLTTKDNPFDPFDEFDAWYHMDEAHGYHTCNVIASRVVDSDGAFPEEDEQAIDEVCDQVIKEFPQIEYVKVYKKD